MTGGRVRRQFPRKFSEITCLLCLLAACLQSLPAQPPTTASNTAESPSIRYEPSEWGAALPATGELGKYLEQARDAERRGHPFLAEHYLKQALELEPRSAVAHHLLSVHYARRREWEKAWKHLSEALEKEPARATLQYNLGALHYNRQQYAEAVQAFRRARELNPEDLRTHRAVVASLQAESLHDRAVAEATKAIERHSGSALLYYDRAFSRVQLGQADEATRDLQAAISLDPAAGDSYYLLGRVSEQGGQYEQALRWYSQTVEREPNHLNAHYRLSLLHARLGDREQAQRHKEIHAQLSRQVKARNALDRGEEAFQAGDFAFAEAQFADVLRFDADNGRALYYSGLLAKNKGELEQARNYFEKALLAEPGSMLVRANLALTLAGLGRGVDARERLGDIGTGSCASFEVCYAAGRTWLALRDFGAAEPLLLESRQLWPAHPGAVADLFQLYALWGKLDQAREYAVTAAGANSDDAQVQYLVGLFWASSRQFDQARRSLQRAAELEPGNKKVESALARVESAMEAEGR